MGPTLLRIAYFHFGREENEQALQRTRRILSETRALDDAIFSAFDRYEVPLNHVLLDGMPPTVESHQSYLRYLLKRRNVFASLETWKWLSAHGGATRELSSQLADLMLSAGDAAAAAGIMQLLPADAQSNLIFNAGGEQDLTYSPFNWQHPVQDGVKVRRDNRERRSGNWSIQVELAQARLRQPQILWTRIYAPPAGWKRLIVRGWLKVRDLVGSDGVSLRVACAVHPEKLAIRTAPVSSRDWRIAELLFDVPAGCTLLNIEFLLDSGFTETSGVSGSVWVDDLSATRR